MLAGWRHVKHIPSTGAGWDAAKDCFSGTEVYGEPSDNTQAWSIKFELSKTNKYRLITSDRSYYGCFTQEEFDEKNQEKGVHSQWAQIKDFRSVDIYVNRNITIEDANEIFDNFKGFEKSKNYF